MVEVIVQGNTSDVYGISVKGYETLDSNWTGRRVVSEISDGTILLDETMTKNDTDTKFLGYLVPTETTALAVGTYNLTFEVSNSTTTPPIIKEHKFIIRIEEGV